MIHATGQLIRAMRGEHPSLTEHEDDHRNACGTGVVGHGVFAVTFGHREAVGLPVDCPACLRAARDAMDPVRWDFLESRGLAWKLEAE